MNDKNGWIDQTTGDWLDKGTADLCSARETVGGLIGTAVGEG